MTKTKVSKILARMFSYQLTIQHTTMRIPALRMPQAIVCSSKKPLRAETSEFPARGIKRTALALVFSVGATFSAAAVANQCELVNAYWHTNMQSLLENINGCDQAAWQKCSQAAAIHYDLMEGSLGQRAAQCGLETPDVPGRDYTETESTDSHSCTSARDDLREVFETRALARMACAAAREGGDDQEWLDSQCTLFRSQMASYHLPFRNLVQSCSVDYQELVATLED